MDEIMPAVSKFGYQTVVILNNSDAGSKIIRRKILEHKKSFMSLYPNVKRQDYAGLLNVASAIVGNSSSGILEAPTFALPAVNIGNREHGRLQGANVINVGYDSKEIEVAIRKALNPKFKERLKKMPNPYGDGKSSKRIVDILESVPIDDKLLIKRITY